jgi:hypothetical protein
MVSRFLVTNPGSNREQVSDGSYDKAGADQQIRASAISAAKREWAQDDHIQHAEDRGVGGDSKRERRQHDQRESGAGTHHPQI